MKRIAGMIFILLILIYIAVYVTFLSMPVADVFNQAVPASSPGEYSIIENSLFNFVESRLEQGNGGILTNLRDYEGSRDTLSESVGLLMNYCVLSNKKELFDKEVEFLKDHMMADSGFIKWREGSSKAFCNASIDDLRIIRALLDGYDRWEDKEYYNLAGSLQSNIFKYQVKERELYELYDWNSGKSRHITPLCYLDLYTIYRMSDFNRVWLAVEDRSSSIIANGRICNSSPFYFKYFDYDKGCYSLDEEYSRGKGICLTYTLYTAIHLAEVNEDTGFLSGWLKEQINHDTLYSWYDPYTLKPVNTMKSTAVYALAAIYAERIDEKELYRQIIDEMLKLRVSDRNSTYFGGFGDPASKYFHSFDNLTALWALSNSK